MWNVKHTIQSNACLWRPFHLKLLLVEILVNFFLISFSKKKKKKSSLKKCTANQRGRTLFQKSSWQNIFGRTCKKIKIAKIALQYVKQWTVFFSFTCDNKNSVNRHNTTEYILHVLSVGLYWTCNNSSSSCAYPSKRRKMTDSENKIISTKIQKCLATKILLFKFLT